MAIVTLTSDLGCGSYQLASLKGTLYSAIEKDFQLVDISNDIAPFNIAEAAFILSSAYKFYPKNTIHIININPFYSSRANLLVLKHNGQFFIAPNHGIIPLIHEEIAFDSINSLHGHENTAELNYVIGTSVNSILNGIEISEFAPELKAVAQKIPLKALVTGDTIRATIIHVDRFGNLVSNIKREKFEKIRNGRPFSIFFRHKDPITKIHEHYHQVQMGDEICSFNIAGYLEIAINLENASQLLGLERDDIIQIDFN